jgi:hypothetical protein
MKKVFISPLLLGLLLFGTACSSEEKKETTEKKEAEKPMAAEKFSLDREAPLQVRWVGYKHTAKVPVEGAFSGYEIMGGEEPMEDLAAYLKTLEVKVDAHTVITQDTARDRKIETFFFDVLSAEPVITGKITDLTMNGQSGTGTISFTMAGVAYSNPFECTLTNGGELTITSTIDVMNWNGKSAIESLTEVCKEKHTGEDGKTVTWSEVKVIISGKLKRSEHA